MANEPSGQMQASTLLLVSRDIVTSHMAINALKSGLPASCEASALHLLVRPPPTSSFPPMHTPTQSSYKVLHTYAWLNLYTRQDLLGGLQGQSLFDKETYEASICFVI